MTSKEGNLSAGIVDDGEKKPSGVKPTKYHYYPHNQHLYLLPECATQQVRGVFVGPNPFSFVKKHSHG